MSNIRSPLMKLNDGHAMPMLGLGTSAHAEVAKREVEEAINIAIDAGYRHFDSAYFYQNEEEIGRAIGNKIAKGTVKRDDIFYTSKLWSTFHRPELVKKSLEASLKKLQMSYVDLYLIHSPMSLKPGDELLPMDAHGKIIYDTVDLCSTWEILIYNSDYQAMEKCKDAGLAKSIGVANFNCRQLEMILNKPGLKYKPVCNQVECHPYHNQRKLLEFCKSKGIVLVAYAALGSNRKKQWVKKDNPILLEDPILNAMAEKYRRTPAQIALRYQLQRGIVVLAKSFNRKRIQENFQVFDFQLTSEDMKTIDDLNRNIQYYSGFGRLMTTDTIFAAKILGFWLKNREVFRNRKVSD